MRVKRANFELCYLIYNLAGVKSGDFYAMPTYTCEKCGKDFNKKTDYARHLDRKISCGPEVKVNDANIDQIAERVADKIMQKTNMEPPTKVGKKENLSVSVIMNLVQKLHDLMRTNGSITGQKAYYDIIRILLLGFMEPYIKPDGKLATLLDVKHYTVIPDFEEKNIKYLLLTNLVIESDKEFEERIYLVWDMLSMHNFTKNIFPKNKAFNSPIKTLELACGHVHNTLSSINFHDLNEDIGGAIYEHFVNRRGGGGGQSLGQFFTPRKLINVIMQINQVIFTDEIANIKSIYDPCAGTCGFLTEVYKYLARNKRQISADNIHGSEIEPDTFANGLMNIMLTCGSICNLSNEDSFKNNSSTLYDWIATNPPFGIKGLKYEDILGEVKFQPPSSADKTDKPSADKTDKPSVFIPARNMYPIKTNDGSALFLQHCIAKLAFKGICNIVLPAGQLITGKNAYEKIRKYLVEECSLYAVLSVPGGVFDNACVATVVLFFSKYPDSCAAETIFYETDQSCKAFKEVGRVSYDDLAKRRYVLDWKFYNKSKIISSHGDSTWKIRSLSEITTYLPAGKRNSSEGNKKGLYPLYYCSILGFLYLNEYDYEDTEIIINQTNGSGKCAIYLADGKYSVAKSVIRIKADNADTTRYIFHYLSYNKDEVEKLYSGVNQKLLDREEFGKMQIAVPSIEKQKEIISVCQSYARDVDKLNISIEACKEIIKITSKIRIAPLFEPQKCIKTLDDIRDIYQGKYASREEKKHDMLPGEMFDVENAILMACLKNALDVLKVKA